MEASAQITARRRPSRRIMVGEVAVGGGAPVSVQSMADTDTRDVGATVEQLKMLAAGGADILRVAVPDMEAANAIADIKRQVGTPLVADIHFDYRLAIAAVAAGADCLRINPGNIGGRQRVKAVAEEAKARGVPVRVGVNSGSLEKALLRKFGGPTPEAMVESALGHARVLEEACFHDIKISLKSASVPATVSAYRMLAQRCDHPLHIGVTAAGTLLSGSIRSAAGLGILLAEGIGDTLRVSLSAPPEHEVRAGIEILRALGLRRGGVTVVCCPTCGRCNADVAAVAERVEKATEREKAELRVAVMGCEVNGPGEAREADVGVAAGKGAALVFRNGKPLRKVAVSSMEDALLDEVRKLLKTKTEEK